MTVRRKTFLNALQKRIEKAAHALKCRAAQQFATIPGDKEFGFLAHCFPGNHIRLDILQRKILFSNAVHINRDIEGRGCRPKYEFVCYVSCLSDL